MTLRKIAQMGEPILREATRPVLAEEIGSPALEALIDDMIETMRDADGAGIAAPQIFEPVSVCVMEIVDNPRYPEADAFELLVLINPVVDPLVPNPEHPADEDAIVMYEGCLSVSGLRGQVRRPRRVRVQALDRAGKRLDLLFEGFGAAVVQHETDHLRGVLFVDRADPRTLCFLREYQRHVPPSTRMVDAGRPPSDDE